MKEAVSGEVVSWALGGDLHLAALSPFSDLYLLPASSLDSQSFVMLPPSDEVVTNLETLTSKCLHGKNYCRQVLCLYELAKVRAPVVGREEGSRKLEVDFGCCQLGLSHDNHDKGADDSWGCWPL